MKSKYFQVKYLYNSKGGYRFVSSEICIHFSIQISSEFRTQNPFVKIVIVLIPA